MDTSSANWRRDRKMSVCKLFASSSGSSDTIPDAEQPDASQGQAEQTEQKEQAEQTEQTEQAEQTEQTEQAEQSEQTEQTDLEKQAKKEKPKNTILHLVAYLCFTVLILLRNIHQLYAMDDSPGVGLNCGDDYTIWDVFIREFASFKIFYSCLIVVMISLMIIYLLLFPRQRVNTNM